MRHLRRGWPRVIVACVTLAMVSLLSNWSTQAEMLGHWQDWSLARKTLSRVVNSGTVWAGVPLYAGWEMRRAAMLQTGPRPMPSSGARSVLLSALAAVCCAEASLTLHYALGQTLGIYSGSVWADNWLWFVVGVVFCAPLGLVGWRAAGPGLGGVLARLLVPVAALVEPLLLGMFHTTDHLSWVDHWANRNCGFLLVGLGLLGVWVVLRATRRQAV